MKEKKKKELYVRDVTERGRRRTRKKIERYELQRWAELGGLLASDGARGQEGRPGEYHRYSLSAHETSVVISAD